MNNKKQSVIVGGLLGSAGIFISKLIGIIYVIPFTALIGESNMVYYSSAFRIYEYLINISLAGLPFAIATLVAKYVSKNDYKTALLIKKISMSIMLVIGLISAICLMAFSGVLAKFMMPDGSSVEVINTTRLVLVIMSFALFFVPLLSPIRGFYQGLKELDIYAKNQVLEQIARVVFLLGCGSICVYIFNMDQIWAVYFAIISTSFSAILAFIHLKIYDKKAIQPINKLALEQSNVKSKSTKLITKELIIIALPFLLIAILGYSFSILDTTFFNKAVESYYLNNSEFSNISNLIASSFNSLSLQSEGILSASSNITYNINTAAAYYSNTLFGISFLKVAKLIAIPMILAPGFSLAIIPYITSSIHSKNYKMVRKYILDCIETVLYLALPVCVCLGILAQPIYYFMYGGANLEIGSQVLRVFSIDAFFCTITPIFGSLLMALELRKYNVKYICISTIIKLLSVSLFLTYFSYPGAVITSVISYVTLIVLDIRLLIKIHKINFKKTLFKIFSMCICLLLMIIVIYLLSMLGLTAVGGSRVIMLFKLGIVGILAIATYIISSYFFYLPQSIFNINIDEIISKFRKRIIKNETR